MWRLTLLLLSFSCLILLSSCKTRGYQANTGYLQFAQVTTLPDDNDILKSTQQLELKQISLTQKEKTAPTLAKAKKKNILTKARELTEIKKKVEFLALDRFTAIKQMNKKQDLRLADILFFV